MGDEVDLTRAGLAQTTMASVEVVRGIAAATSYSSSMGLRAGSSSLSDGGKRGSLFGTGWFGKDKNNKSKGKAKINRNSMVGPNPTLVRSGSTKGRRDDETPLGFTSYRAPPVYVGAGSVLVQVWAVGLDGVDGRLVGVQMDSGGVNAFSSRDSEDWIDKADGSKTRDKDKEKIKPAPVGYIPGRSFVGRVLEVGWEVREETAKKGDWVVGLLGVGKCGALAEFILVDRHRVHRIPHPVISPTMQPPSTSSFPVSSRHSQHISSSSSPEARQHISSIFLPGNEGTGCGIDTKPNHSGLTVEELALLPLCGVPAYRAVRTLGTITQAMAKPVSSSASSSTVRPRSMVHETPRRFDMARSPLGRESSSEEDSETENVSDQAHHRVQGDPHPYGVGVNEYKQHDNAAEARPRVLVLRAHDGSGALAVQMLVKAGWSVWAHVPVPFELPGPPLSPLAKWSQCEDDDESGVAEESKVLNGDHEKELERRRVILKRIEDRLRGWG
ncbi:hypothetical protein SERLA73DRAFT_176842, partial [Serpula lacrymans var. lacrymans S7.3]